MHTKQHINTYVFGLALLVELLSSTGLLAQNVYRDLVEDWGDDPVTRWERDKFYNPVDGELYRVQSSNDSSSYDVVVPDSISSSYLKVLVRGADGGFFSDKLTVTQGGGEGATVWATFKMGAGTGEIQGGGTLRFIIGGSDSGDPFLGGSSKGGGGTGLAYKDPGTGQWSILAVAGGGGGAGDKRDGVPGQITEEGSPGRGYGGNGGSDGKAGKDNTGKYSGAGEPGKGYKDSMQDGEPVGSEGSATWGFGGGGKPNTYGGNSGGGGGGGYSGGGGGRRPTANGGGGGGGGGSYVNTDFAVNSIKIANGSNGGSYDGFVEYKFSDDPDLVSREIQVKAASDKCLDLYKGLTDNGNNIQLYQCTGRSPQQWFYDGLYIRLAKNTDKCVNLKDGDMDKGYIQLRDCYNKARQHWIYDGFSGVLRSGKNLDYCLDLENGSTANDTDVRVAPCKESSNTQQWLIEGAAELVNKSGVKTIRLADNTCMTLEDGITSNDKSKVTYYNCVAGKTTQQWTYDGQRIKYNDNQDKCLNLVDAETSNGTNIKLRDCYDKDRQVWIYNGFAQSIHSAVDPSKCIQVNPYSPFNVELYDCDGSYDQKWLIE